MRPVLVLLLALGMGACSGSHEPRHSQGMAPAPVMLQDKVVLDVPGLLTLNIDEIGRQIGPRLPVPAGLFDPIMVPVARHNEKLDSTTLFRSRGLVMLASYDYHTRKLSNLLLLGTDEEKLMRLANLKLGTAQYLVMPVFQEKRPTLVQGLRLIPIEVDPNIN